MGRNSANSSESGYVGDDLEPMRPSYRRGKSKKLPLQAPEKRAKRVFQEPAKNINAEDFLSDKEKKQFLLQWLATDKDRWKKWHSLFAKPDASLTYFEAWSREGLKSNMSFAGLWQKIRPDVEAKIASIKSNAGYKEYGLSPFELLAVNTYTSAIYSKLNSALRNGQNRQQWDTFIHLMDQALTKLPDVKATLYRNVNFPAEIRTEYQIGKTVSDNGYASTSRKKQYEAKDSGCSSGWGSTILIISAHNGKSLLGLSDFSNEKEVLLPRGSKFKVNAINKDHCFEYLNLEEQD